MKIFFLIKNFYWNILYYIYIINKLIEFPIIFITHIILLLIYINNKKKNKIKYLIILTTIPIILLIIKKIIKNIIFIKRPYNLLIKKKNINIPNWLINYWKNKNDSSFPSGHTIYSIFWILNFYKKKTIYKYIIIFIFTLIIISRILLYLHNIQDIIFSIIINILFKYIY